MMSEKNSQNIILEEYENNFLYKKSKSNLNIQFNRVAFVFFIIFTISIISITSFRILADK